MQELKKISHLTLRFCFARWFVFCVYTSDTCIHHSALCPLSHTPMPCLCDIISSPGSSFANRSFDICTETFMISTKILDPWSWKYNSYTWSKTEKGRINKECNFWCQKYKNGPECKYPGNCFSHFFCLELNPTCMKRVFPFAPTPHVEKKIPTFLQQWHYFELLCEWVWCLIRSYELSHLYFLAENKRVSWWWRRRWWWWFYLLEAG